MSSHPIDVEQDLRTLQMNENREERQVTGVFGLTALAIVSFSLVFGVFLSSTIALLNKSQYVGVLAIADSFILLLLLGLHWFVLSLMAAIRRSPRTPDKGGADPLEPNPESFDCATEQIGESTRDSIPNVSDPAIGANKKYEELTISDRRGGATEIEELSNRERELQAIFDGVSDALTILDDRGTYLQANPAAWDLFGLDESQLLGHRLAEFIDAESNSDDNFDRVWAEFLQRGKMRGKCRIVRGDGTTREVEFSATANFLPGRHLSIARDITDRQRAETALGEREQQLSAIAANIPGSIYRAVIGDDGRLQLTYISPGVQALYEISPEVAIADPQSLFDCIHPEDRSTCDRLRRQASANLADFDCRYRIVTPSGRVKWIRETGRCSRDRRGAFIIDGVCQDISDLHGAIAARQQRDRQFQALVENSPDIIARFDRDRRHVYINPAIEKATGIPPDTFLGKTNSELGMPPESVLQWDRALMDVFATGRSQTLEFDFLTPIGRHYYQSRLVPELDAEGGVESVLSVVSDITELKQTEAALRANQHLLQQIADTTPTLICIYDLTCNCDLYLNRESRMFLGLPTEGAIVGGTDLFMQRTHPDDRPFWQDVKIRLTQLDDGEIFENEYRLQHADGQWRWLHSWEVVFQRNREGQPQQILSVAIDITQRRQVQKQLSQSEVLYRTLVQNFPNGAVVLFDRDLRYTFAEGTALFDVGLSKLSLEGKTIWESFDPATCEILEPPFRTVFAGQSSVLEMPYGDRFYTVHVLPVADDRGEIYAGLCMTQDITDRKQAELELLEERNFIAAVLDTAGALVIVLDREGKIVRFNRACERMTGYPFDEVKDRVFWEFLLLPEEREAVKQEFNHLIETTPSSEYENYWVAKDGSRRLISWSNTLLFDRDRSLKYIIGIGIDITDRKRAEKVERALQREQELNQLQLRFFSMVSHEFRTPLSTILMSAQSLEKNSPNLSPGRILKNSRRIQRSVQHTLQLLDDILTLNRAETGKLEFQPAPLNLIQVYRQIIEEVRLTFDGDRPLNFSYDRWLLPPSRRVSMDAKLLRSIALNLLSNAMKYSPQGEGIEVELSSASGSIDEDGSVRLSGEGEPNLSILTVKDRGIGIPESDLPHLFEAFHRGANVGSIPGTGLGLTVVKKCVDLHGAAIAVTSNVEGDAPVRGTTFTVTIPFSI
jgi:PAS domain S-box-containing protein